MRAEDYVIQAPGRDMVVSASTRSASAVDSIALDRRGEWLYYGAGERRSHVPGRAPRDLNDPSLSPEALGARVEDYGPKTAERRPHHRRRRQRLHQRPGALGRAGARTGPHAAHAGKDPRLRWPDGFSFGPDGWLYVTCSSLQHVLFVARGTRRAHAPYQIYRFKPGGGRPRALSVTRACGGAFLD